jgi:hypothetical protein
MNFHFDCSDYLLQRRRNEKLLRRCVIFQAQYIRLAANLAIFDVALPPPRGFIHSRDIPLTATRALETCFHLRLP